MESDDFGLRSGSEARVLVGSTAVALLQQLNSIISQETPSLEDLYSVLSGLEEFLRSLEDGKGLKNIGHSLISLLFEILATSPPDDCVRALLRCLTSLTYFQSCNNSCVTDEIRMILLDLVEAGFEEVEGVIVNILSEEDSDLLYSPTFIINNIDKFTPLRFQINVLVAIVNKNLNLEQASKIKRFVYRHIELLEQKPKLLNSVAYAFNILINNPDGDYIAALFSDSDLLPFCIGAIRDPSQMETLSLIRSLVEKGIGTGMFNDEIFVRKLDEAFQSQEYSDYVPLASILSISPRFVLSTATLQHLQTIAPMSTMDVRNFVICLVEDALKKSFHSPDIVPEFYDLLLDVLSMEDEQLVKSVVNILEIVIAQSTDEMIEERFRNDAYEEALFDASNILHKCSPEHFAKAKEIYQKIFGYTLEF